MTLQRAVSGKCFRDDRYLKMTGSALGAFMPGMQMALIFHLQHDRRKSLGEFRLYRSYALDGHGSTRLKGLTVTLLYTPARR